MATRPETTRTARVLLGILVGLGLAAESWASDAIPRASGVVWEPAPASSWDLRLGDEVLVRLSPTLVGGWLADPSGWTHRSLDDPELDPAPVSLEPRHWSWFHLDDILFLRGSADLSALPGFTADAGLRWSRGSWELRRVEVTPHHTVGRVSPVECDVAWGEATSARGRRLLIAVVPLAGGNVVLDPDARALSWTGPSPGWSVAVVTAPTVEVLEYALGQAWLAYAGPELADPGIWQAPALCARCQSPEIPDLRLTVRRTPGAIEVRTTCTVEHHRLSPGGFRLAGHDMGPYLVDADATTARYRVPVTDPLAEVLVRRSGTLDPELLLASGQRVRPGRVEMDRGPRAGAPSSARWPGHLRAELVEAHPNPFHEQTTLRIRVPRTLGESFDFEAAKLPTAGLDLDGPSPVGARPQVRVRIYNVGGKLIRTLDERTHPAGTFGIAWDGQDDQGREVAAGAYYVNVEMDDYAVTRRVLRLKP